MTYLRHVLLFMSLMVVLLFGKKPDIYTYMLTENDFKELEAIESIFALLDKQKDLVYPDTSAMLQAIQGDLKDFPEAYPFIASQIRDQISLHSEYAFLYCSETNEVDCPVRKIWMDSLDLEQLKKELRNSGRFVVVAPQAIQLAKSIKDIQYPDSALFQSALRHRIMHGMNLCPQNLTSQEPTLRSLKMNATDYEELKTLWSQKSNQSKKIFAWIDSVRLVKKTCSPTDWENVSHQIDMLYKNHMQQAISARYVKYFPLDTSLTIKWSGIDCGCTQVDQINGVTYGFFPFWMAQRHTQRMDFGVMKRVAYYGLTFDASGVLTYANQNNQANAQSTRTKALNFVRKAHQFNSRVDWVIEKNQWGANWIDQNEEARRLIFQKLADQITAFITQPLEDAVVRVAEKVSYSGDDPRTRGDGVSLYFRNYPTDSISTQLFEDFFRQLKVQLKAKGGKYYVNFMATRSEMSRNKGIYSYKTYRRFLENDDLPQGMVMSGDKDLKNKIRSYLILFLEEPTSQSKQLLRFDLDNAFQGIDHKIMMRSLIPTLTFDYKSWYQLSEDIAYFNDAFYGIGLWPIQPTLETITNQTCEEGSNLPNCLRQYFLKDGFENDMPNLVDRWVCAHRWALRLAFFVTAVLLVILLLLVIFVCPIRHRLAKNPLLVIALCVLPPFTLFTLLLFYDPVLSALRTGNWPYLIALFMVLIGVTGVVAVMRYQKEKPVRMGA